MMTYLTEEEKNSYDALLQIVIGLQHCKTKRDVVELLKEAQGLAVDEYKQYVREIFNKVKKKYFFPDTIIINDIKKELGL